MNVAILARQKKMLLRTLLRNETEEQTNNLY